ncbi:H+/gluconate symporter-like permease [Natronospira proteinivora]|uniref:H+/gluconate symporter-like permease n=1 Tax=Natronospira proteinivora TaxID=1807133 RepID=A0ABT1GBD4_9GAMM|nr:SLC13 family permease [Natronospira proteinivora]MCP1727222.1 H+/gluconate symporter-like permease [Natronospira proteinivora]
MLSVIGLLGALTLLIYLTMRGLSLFVATPFCALIVALTSGLALLPPLAETEDMDLVSQYMEGFTGFIASWFFVFLLGSLFGKMMEASGSAESVANWIINHLGTKRAALAVVMACAVLTYGGVSLFVVAFSVYPMAVSLFREANLPRRFIPATLAFGSVTFTMTSAGSPEIQNWIPVEHLGTSPLAAWEASLIVAIFMATTGYWWLTWMLKRAVKRGETFDTREEDTATRRDNLPHPGLAIIPLSLVLGISFTTHDTLGTSALILALLAGCIGAALTNPRYLKAPGQALTDGGIGALIAIGNTSAVVGFGSVARVSPAFESAVDWVTGIPGAGLTTAALAVSVIAALTGSASGGQAIALPILGQHYIDQGVDPDQLHRTVAISSGALDSLPHNGYVVTTIRAICKETHAAAYAPVGALTVIVPLAGLVLCLGLFAIGL